MESGTTRADYRLCLRSIKSLEDVRKLEEANVERFLFVESFGGLLDTLTIDDEHCSVPGRYLEGWNAFKGALIELVTRRGDIRRLTPLIQRTIPLLRYLDEEDRSILAEDFWVTTADDMYEYGQKICVTIAENACVFGLPILTNLLDRMAQTAKIRQTKFLEIFMGVSCDVVKKLETKFSFLKGERRRSSKSESSKEAHVEQELHVMVTVVLYTLKVINKEDVEDNFPREILVADSCGLKDFRFAIIYLFRLGKAIGIASRLDEAIILLQLSCESAWKGILVFCESPDPKSDEIYSLITDTCATSGILMCMLHDETKIIKTLKYNLMSWFDARLLCEEIPSPLAIVEAWVYIQYKGNQHQDPQAWDNIETTHALMSSLDKITIDALQILTEQVLFLHVYPIILECQLKIVENTRTF
ncbi:hypothetical protein Tco_1107948 [Tanacetum coccineum]